MNEWKVRLLTTSNSMLAFNILQICYMKAIIRIKVFLVNTNDYEYQ